MVSGQRSLMFTSHITLTDRATPSDVAQNQNVHDTLFNLHVKLHGNFITVNLSTVPVLYSLPVILLGLHDPVL
jgi:hypothetical protein